MPSISHIIDKEHGYAVRIPEQTPDGQTVSVETNTSEDVHVLHAYSPDRSALYFEIATFPELMSHQVLTAAQQRFLSEHSTDGQIDEPRQQILVGHKCTAFDFRGEAGGDWRRRRFLFLDGSDRTYRIVYDPTSKLNEQVFQSFSLRD